MAKNEERSPLVVCDAGPLIHLDEVGCLDVLADFAEVLVPEAVWQEVHGQRATRWRANDGNERLSRPA
jgi:predicted nucleic acid-binding protein